ncbi:MAG: FkbM family methyltransferase [Gemmobacter sp.]
MANRLDGLFDDDRLRTLPLTHRDAVTALLERALHAVIDAIQPDLFVEIGAFEAAFSLTVRKRFAQARVIAFEGNPRVALRFGDKARAAGVDYRAGAVSDADGDVTFNIVEVVAGKEMPEANRMGSLHDLGLRDSRTVPVTVPAARLDTVLRDVPASRACLWVDVEGAATAVLRGAGDTLARTAIVYCEVESRSVWKDQELADAVAQMMAEAGFVLAARDCQKWFQKNCLFLRPGVAADAAVQAILAQYETEAGQSFEASVAAFLAAGKA